MGTARRIQVLHVDGCPGAAAVRATRPDIVLERQVVGDEREAVRYGMTGSPTLLVDGADPFATGAAPSLSCRLYRDERGGVSGSPSPAQLRGVLPSG